MSEDTRIIELPTLNCLRCGHTWHPRYSKPPDRCPRPRCKSPYWNKPRRRRIINQPVTLADASDGDIVLTLPDAVESKGKTFIIRKVDKSKNTVTIREPTKRKIE